MFLAFMSITRDALELTGNNARIWRIVLLLSTLVLEMRGGWYKWSVIEQFTRTQCTDGSNSNSKGAPINCGKVLKLKRFNKLSEKISVKLNLLDLIFTKSAIYHSMIQKLFSSSF